MISRLRRASALAALLVGAALLTVACQKVPLLAPSGSTITLTALATALPSNGTTQIIAQVIEASGTPPHSGTLITFTTNLGTIRPSEAETDISGKVIVNYLAGSGSGTATITAISGGVSASGANAIKIAVGAAAATSLAVSASPGTVAASGGSSTVTATVLDSSGNRLPGVPVTFTADNGSLSAAVVSTDSTGTAQTIVTTSRTTKVTATAGVSAPGSGSGTGATPATTAATGSVTINVNAASTIAVGTASPATPAAGQAVTFPLTYTQNTNGSPVARVVVDFGDGSASQTINGQPSAVTHAYSSPGSYTVRVTAFDTFGDAANGTGSVTVAPKAQLVVTLDASANPTPGTTTTFTITATPTTGNAIVAVTINFGDGTPPLTLTGNTKTVQHVYAAAGSYTATATATDSSGASGSGSTVIVVSNPVTARFTFTPNPGKATQPVTFDASSSTAGSGIASYAWTFGESGVNNSASGVTAQHTYAAAGTYTVTLTVTDNNQKTSSTNQQVTVVP